MNVEQFVERWQGASGTEKTNYQFFLTELTELPGLPRPDPASDDTNENAYVFERRVTFSHAGLPAARKNVLPNYWKPLPNSARCAATMVKAIMHKRFENRVRDRLLYFGRRTFRCDTKGKEEMLYVKNI